MKKRPFLFILIVMFFVTIFLAKNTVFPGANEKTASKAEYFSWINNTNEGTTTEHSLINLAFFKWLKEEYGMQIDIYAFDAGAIDGKRFYGSMYSDRFKNQFPKGFDPIFKKAKNLGIRLGIWGGPDGFGDTPEKELKRTEEMVTLCRDFNFALFKFDAVCGPLRPEKEDAFINMMKECRKYSPDLILLNHRLGLKKAKPYATTFLWGGAETYIDVFMTNNTTAPHHRAAAISRGLVPGLKRLTEDHGVCLSSCLDYWDDDLILQAFNRNLILSPQIYGNPWLLRDDEFPKLSRIFNLHRKYKKILVNGITLPESQYGPFAVSRGNNDTRLITLRNLTWEPVEYKITMGSEIGITTNEKVELIQIHPCERYKGTFGYNEKIKITVEPFRSALFIATTKGYNEPLITGSDFNIVRNIKGRSVLIDILGDPGSDTTVGLKNHKKYQSVKINGRLDSTLLSGKKLKIRFPGRKLFLPPDRKIADMKETNIPYDAEALYEATVFAADNNALEVRSFYRSGKSGIPEVIKAREAFFTQRTFVDRGVWDKNLFDNNLKTGFWPSRKYGIDLRVKKGALRVDLGDITDVDNIVIEVPDIFSLQPLLPGEGNYAEISTDLQNWKTITYLAGKRISIPVYGKMRYLRLKIQPGQIVEIKGYFKGKPLDRRKWKASNLFAHPENMKPVKSWKSTFVLKEIPKRSYLSVAINGKHGVEGAYVAAKINGILTGAPDRAPSFPSNTWEYIVAKRDENYTYFIPLKSSYEGDKIEVYVLAYDQEKLDISPTVWLSSGGVPGAKIRMELEYRTEEQK